VFGGAVGEVTPARGGAPPKTGDAVVVTDHAGAPLGWGTFNDTSMYRVRLLGAAAEAATAPHLALDVEATIQGASACTLARACAPC
jgi:hypothetical protein